MKRKIFFGTILLIVLGIGIVFGGEFLLQKKKKTAIKPMQNLQEMKTLPVEKSSQDAVETEIKENITNDPIKNEAEESKGRATQIEKLIQIKVPFTPQAPFGDWSDERFQNGCEEASVAMAMRWVRNNVFSSPSDAEKEIKSLAKFEDENFGFHVDTSLETVGEIFSEHYGFKGYSVRHAITKKDLKEELANGNILLVPAYGRALKNPNYTSPGPITHMLVVIGYDPVEKKFITNDPGTRRGENYRYDEDILFGAIWEYPDGAKHPPLPEIKNMKKGMIVISLK